MKLVSVLENLCRNRVEIEENNFVNEINFVAFEIGPIRDCARLEVIYSIYRLSCGAGDCTVPKISTLIKITIWTLFPREFRSRYETPSMALLGCENRRRRMCYSNLIVLSRFFALA